MGKEDRAVRVDFHLRRRPHNAPASALLLLSHNAADLARLWARIGGDPLPPAYLVADGVLVRLPVPCTEAFGGALRLRALADNLFLPVDADLVPTLLPEEAADLARQRGLIFLPGGRILEFDPARPLPLAAALRTAPIKRDPWRPLAEPEPLADRLTEITLEQPELPPDDLLAAGGEGIGTEEPLPDDAGLPSRTLGKTAYGAGKAMAWLGKMLGLKGLAAAGGKWMAAGLGWAPGLAESVLGRQQALLRELLRAFREGNIEKALRRALPLTDDLRGATHAAGASLPFNDLHYSLHNILSGTGGPGASWFTEADLYRELQRQYRRQAELAVQRGDYRRAAFIHGKLLRDYRAAAAVLSQGGLHRDAAILYLKRLDDPLAAAREYEAAGEIDRALALYRRRGEHLLAADLLRRTGDEEQALEEYRLAADQAVASGRGHYEAGELLRTRARRPDLALPYYEAGWAQRSAGNAVPCALRLAQTYTDDGETDKLFTLADEAEEYLAPPGSSGAAELYNELARLADRLREVRTRDDLRDRALTGITRKLRQWGGPGPRGSASDVVSTMLGTSQVWAPAVVSDAQFAMKRLGKQTRSPTASITRFTVQARLPLVSGVCQAASSGDVFMGFESGEVVCFRPRSGEVSTLFDGHGPVLSLAARSDGGAVVVLTSRGSEGITLTGIDGSQVYSMDIGSSLFPETAVPTLCSALAGDGKRYGFALFAGREWRFFRGPPFVPVDEGELPVDEGEPAAVFLLSPTDAQAFAEPILLALYDHGFVSWNGHSRVASAIGQGGWRPAKPGSALRFPALSWLEKGPAGVEIVGIDAEGCLYASEVRLDNGVMLAEVSTKALPGPPRFLAAAVLRPNLIAAVTSNAVYWLRRRADGLRVIDQTKVSLPLAVACFRDHQGKELIVVCANGTVVRVPAFC
jgi:tetratricopeptide (TPR) repeat protein